MKEAYLQEKIRELNYKLRQQMDLSEQLNQELHRLQTALKQHKHLIKQLKAFDSYKETTLQTLTAHNEKTLRSVLEKTQQTLHHEIQATMNKQLAIQQKKLPPDHSSDIKLLHSKIDTVLQSTQYTQALLAMLIEHLVTERIIAQDQADILLKRAQIRANKK